MNTKTENFIAALNDYDRIANWLAGFDALKTAREAELRQLEGECDLDDPAALRKVGDLQIVCTLLPRRHIYQEERRTEADEVLGRACEAESIKISVRLDEIQKNIRANLTQKMKAHFSSETDLENAMNSTLQFQEIRQLRQGLLRYRSLGKSAADWARQILATAEAMETFAEKHGLLKVS